MPWPEPVNASEPWRLTRSPATRAPVGRGHVPVRISSRKRLAALIGPIVWELDGPMPILKTSKTERNISDIPIAWHHCVSRNA